MKIPSVILRQLQKNSKYTTLHITRGIDKCLYLFTEEDWAERARRMESLSLGSESARKFEAKFFGAAFAFEPDALGRFVIPEQLRRYIDNATDVVFVGARSRVEVWAANTWEAECNDDEEAFRQAAAQVLI